MITNLYTTTKHYVNTDSGELCIVKMSFPLDSITDVEGLKSHLNYPFSFENGPYIYFCDVIESVEFEEVNGE